MTVAELIERLKELPQDYEVTFLENVGWSPFVMSIKVYEYDKTIELRQD